MKRIIRNLFLILLIFSVPVAMTSGQEKKNEEGDVKDKKTEKK